MQDHFDSDIRKNQPVPAGNLPAAGSKPHTLWAVDRREVTVKGVTDVLSFDEHAVELVTTSGRMTLDGRDLHVTVLDTVGGIVTVTGLLCGVFYETPDEDDAPGKRRGRGHLFR